MNNIKKTFITLLIVLHIFVQSRAYVYAEEVVSPTPEPQVTSTTTEQTTSSQETSSTTQTTQTNSETQPTPTPVNTEGYHPDTQDQNKDLDGNDDYDYDANDPDNAARKYREEQKKLAQQQALAAAQTTPTPTPTANPTASSGVSQNGQNGDTTLKTGDATSTAIVGTLANQNVSATPTGSGQGASIVNSGNGTQSNNNGSATIGNTNTSNQSNTANVDTKLTQGAVTGSNTTSDNVGDSSISTGDANVTGTVITSVNTNVDGVMVAEFNIADDHVGDILLDFGANCISGCGTGSANVSNTGNGSDSTNTANLDTTNNDSTFQTNDATIGSELTLSADSGNNEAIRNTGGDSNIKTGDANVSANALTFANNNIAGDVVYAVVNIFEDLVGDILLPTEMLESCCNNQATASNTGNGSGSTNDASVSTDNTTSVFQNNDADLTNTLVFDAQTGNNETSRNTGGDSSVKTGDTYVDANVLNVVNNNLIGGNMWLVIVNEAGNWIGKIIGAPEDSNFAGSQGTEFTVDDNGYITASNNGNGSGSTNNANVDQSNANTISQTNNANVTNTLNLSANTGGNQATDNTGGNSQIKTGDANIVANLVNFVNNNIVGNGKLFVTVVNVFGSWMGDFVAPGQQKQTKEHTQQAVGGPNPSQETTNANDSTSTAQNKTKTAKAQPTPTAVQPTPTQTVVAYAAPVTTANTVSYTKKPLTKKAAVVKSAVLGETAVNTKTKVKVNLAWMMLLIPIIGFFVTKKAILPKFRK